MAERALAERVAERDRLLDIVARYKNGELRRSELPMDVQQYPGRIVELNRSIEQQQSWERQHERQMSAAESAAYEGSRRVFSEYAPQSFSSPEELFEAASTLRRWVRREAEEQVDSQAERYPTLSQDDWVDATIRGGDRAANEYFVEQKKAHGFSYEEEENMVEQTQETESLTREIGEHLAARSGEIDREWRSVAAASAAEAGAATNYFRGRADEWNATREAFVRSHPELEKDLPAALQVDEIQVRQVALEQEREHERTLAIAR